MSHTYSVAALVAAHTAFRDLLDAEAGAGEIRIRDSGGVLLATATLDSPSGSVNGTTGQLTLTVATQETNAPASGTADTADIVDGAGAVHLTMDVVQGTSAQDGLCVVADLEIVAGGAVNVVSAVIG